MDEFSALLQSLSPENQQLLLGMGSLDDRGALLEKQMAQAQALRAPRSGSGGLLGQGLADFGNMMRDNRGREEADGIRSQQSALLDKQDAGRLAYAKALAQALRAQADPTNPMAMAEAGAAAVAQNPDMGQLALPPRPGPSPANAGMGDMQPGGPQAPQKGWGPAQADPRLQWGPFGPRYG